MQTQVVSEQPRNKIVTKIDANPMLVQKSGECRSLRVAAYCRVSTDSDEQLESYEAQVSYYTDLIAKNPQWQLAGIYADEGITGTSAYKRDSFLRLMRDCNKGKVDLIVTKSVARFARNTVDSLSYARKLKAKGIGIFFEEQALDTRKENTEMVLGIYSVMAQAESENISANVRWGIQQRMKSGAYQFRYNIIGYIKGENGEPEIETNGAAVIRSIYERYLDGFSLDQIKRKLESDGVRTATGKTVWSKAIIRGILTNERYTGDMLLQKTFTENCITKKVVKNRGEMAKYLITNNHPAIIDRETFRLVQSEMARRNSKRRISDQAITPQGKYSGKYALSELLICGECGSPYRRRHWRCGGNMIPVWRCLNRVEHGTTYCHAISIPEQKLHATICRGLSQAIENREDVMQLILSNLSYAITGNDNIPDAYVIEQKIKETQGDMDDMILLSMRTEGDTDRFEKEIRKLSDRLCILREQLELAKQRIAANNTVQKETERLKKALSDTAVTFSQYDDVTVRRLIECIRVLKDGKLRIILKGGLKIEETIE